MPVPVWGSAQGRTGVRAAAVAGAKLAVVVVVVVDSLSVFIR